MGKTTSQPKYLVEARGPEVDGAPKDLITSRRNRYLLVNLIARRARELNRGERTLTDLPEPHTATELAIAEIERDRLHLIRRPKSKVLVSLIKNE